MQVDICIKRRIVKLISMKFVEYSRAEQNKANQDKTRRDKTRQGKARQGKASQGKARQGKAKQAKHSCVLRPHAPSYAMYVVDARVFAKECSTGVSLGLSFMRAYTPFLSPFLLLSFSLLYIPIFLYVESCTPTVP